MKSKRIYLFLLFLIAFISHIEAQNVPSSLLDSEINSQIDDVIIHNPFIPLKKTDKEFDLLNYTFAVAIENLNLAYKGKWLKNKDGEWIWLLKIKADDAKALSVDFRKINIGEGDELFIFNKNKNVYSISSINVKYDKNYSSSFFEGDNITVEFNPNINDTLAVISKSIIVNYAFKQIKANYGFGTSGDCEINAVCNDNENYDPEQRAVVRIRTVKTVNGKTWLGWCTGTIIGNANKDYTPYMLTADHCYDYMIDGKYEGASAEDLDKWKFYFNYDSPTCNNPTSEGNLAMQSLTGAIYKANAGTAGDADSDFCLLELKSQIPATYNPFWAGWDNRNMSSPNGFCYHHPSGDIKKINIYNKSTLSSQYDSRGPANTHWEVFWESGVTEAGSSGSPLFNCNGQIIGVLTGGESSCVLSTSSDYYGKISYSWQYKPENNSQLKNWLDPKNTNTPSIIGYDSKGEKKLSYEKEIKIFSNPITNGTINLGHINPSLLKEIVIYNIGGKEVYREKQPNKSIFKLNITRGIYFAKTNYNGKLDINKILIID
jgi:hypothetical protein